MHLLRKTTHEPCSFSPALPEKAEAKSDPVAIGTRGTVGSLIMQEIDHFSRLNLGDTTNLKKPKLDSVITIPRRKKRQGKRLVPSMCSMVEVANINQPSSLSVFAYRNLKNEILRGCNLRH